MIDRNLIKNYRFVFVINWINDKKNDSQKINNFNEFRSLFEKKFKVFEHDIDFAHENLIQALDIIVYLKIVNDKKFDTNLSRFTSILEFTSYEFVVVVNSKTNAFIALVFYMIEKKFEKKNVSFLIIKTFIWKFLILSYIQTTK